MGEGEIGLHLFPAVAALGLPQASRVPGRAGWSHLIQQKLPVAQHRAEVPSLVTFQQQLVSRRFLPFVVTWDGKDNMPKLEKI